MNCEQGITHTYWDYQKEKKEGKRRNVWNSDDWEFPQN
jgi:hypothetical protein